MRSVRITDRSVRKVILRPNRDSMQNSRRRWGQKGSAGAIETQREVVIEDETLDEEVRAPFQPRARPRQFPRKAASVSGGGIQSVCVIGGGPSGLSCCRALCDAGLDVTLVQESRGLGGKLCTKFVNGHDDPSLNFDMGVQMIQPMGPLSTELEGAVEPWPLAGRFKCVRCKGDWNSWRIVSTLDLPTAGYVVGVPSMSKIGRHLAAQCKGIQMHVDRTANVRGRDPKTGQWEVEWKREAATGGQLRYRPELADVPTQVGRGDFDAVVLAFEANKILRGCKSGYKMTGSSATPAIRSAISGKARTSAMWNLMVAFDTELPMPWDAATLEGHPAISWIAVNSSKPQRARVPQCFMIFSTQEWADWKQWGKREVESELLKEFTSFLQVVLGSRPPKPCFVLSGRWGNNTETVLTHDKPKGEFPMRAVSYHEGEAGVVWDSSQRMGATGDWTRGFSVSDAYAAGAEIAASIVSEADTSMGG